MTNKKKHSFLECFLKMFLLLLLLFFVGILDLLYALTDLV